MTAPASAISRPLRAVVLVLGSWTAGRTAVLWPAAAPALTPPQPGDSAPYLPVADMAALHASEPRGHGSIVDLPTRSNEAAADFADRSVIAPNPMHPPPSSRAQRSDPRVSARSHGLLRCARNDTCLTQTALSSIAKQAFPKAEREGSAAVVGRDVPQAIKAAVPAPFLEPALAAARTPTTAAAPDRFSASAWLLLRGAGPTGLAPSGTLGGSQAGVRVFYEPGRSGIALTARVSTPLAQPVGREASLGIALRHGNIGLLIEQRVALDRGGRSAPSLTAFGGVSDVKILGQLRADGYVQAGIVGLSSSAGFADGALRVEHPLADIRQAKIAVGAGAWGGVQPALARFDVGPQVVVRVPLGNKTMRISGEWRVRVAGNAAPQSGPAVTVGIDL